MLDAPYDNAMGKRQRLAAFRRYMAGAFLRGMRMPRPDVIFGTSTPLTAAWVADRVAALRGVPWVFEVRDLWPDFPIQMGAVRAPWLQRRLLTLERRLYRRAAHIVPLSPDMERHILRQNIPPARVTTLLNGTDFEWIDRDQGAAVAALDAQHHLQDKQVVLYAGTFGRANDIPTILHAAERLAGEPRILFVLLGEGFKGPDVAEAAERLPNVVLVPPVPRPDTFTWMKRADLSLVTFIDRPVLAANSPAKFFDSLGSGTPVLVTNPGWTKRFVEDHACGWYVPPENPEALAGEITRILARPDLLDAYGARGAKIARLHFDREELAVSLEEILRNAARPAGR
jgi:glycosyltransferase involved in cell wall biosynthesis